MVNLFKYLLRCAPQLELYDVDIFVIHDSLDGFEERYCGEWDSEEDFACHIVESCYDLESRRGDFQHYFDYEAYDQDLFIDDYQMVSNGYMFRRY